MTGRSLFRRTLAASLLLLSGCDAAQSARADLTRLVSSDPFKAAPQRPATRPAPAAKPAPATQTAAAAAVPAADATPQASVPASLIGKSEGDVRALFGPPTSVEERAPGKLWRYRDGSCALDVQLYPDVQTRQFATLAYEVKSDDNTDQGNRACLGQLKSHAQAR